MFQIKYFLISLGALIILLTACRKNHPDQSPQGISQDFYIDEDSPNGTSVGIVIAVDRYAKTILRYSIADGNKNDAFTINPITGRIAVSNSDALDYEKDSLYILRIAIKDDTVHFNSDTTEIRVHLNDLYTSSDDLACYLPLDGDVLDKSGISSDSASNVVFYYDRFGNKTGACQFLGAFSYIKIKNQFDSRQRTIGLWFKTDTFSKDGYGMLYCSDNAKLNFGSTALSVCQANKTYRLVYKVSDTSDSIMIDRSKWYHTVLLVDNDTVKCYLNDVLFSQKYIPSITKSNDGYSYTYIGVDRIARSDFFAGFVDDVYVYNRALSRKEILLLFRE